MLLIPLAIASPRVDAQVSRVDEAQRFTLETAHTYRYTTEPREITAGWLFRATVPPWTQRRVAIGAPVLFVGDDIAGRLNWDDRHGCALMWVPASADLTQDPVFFGSLGLPETIGPADAARLAAVHADQPPVARTWTDATLHLEDFSALAEVARRWAEACPNAEAAGAR